AHRGPVARDRPAGLLGDRLLDEREDLLEVLRGLQRRRGRELDPVFLELLDERQVEAGVLVGRRELPERAGGFPLQPDWHEDERGEVRLLRALLLLPLQHAEREEERVDALLLDREPRVRRRREEPRRQRLLRVGRREAVVGVLVP